MNFTNLDTADQNSELLQSTALEYAKNESISNNDNLIKYLYAFSILLMKSNLQYQHRFRYNEK